MLTRKERKRLAKGKTLVRKVKKSEAKPIIFKSENRFDLNKFEDICEDFIAAIRREQYTRGYMQGMKDLEHGKYNKHEFAEYENKNKTDREMLTKINGIFGEERQIIMSGIITYFREKCYIQGYNSAIPFNKIILPVKRK